jgi:hypothetical protein
LALAAFAGGFGGGLPDGLAADPIVKREGDHHDINYVGAHDRPRTVVAIIAKAVVAGAAIASAIIAIVAHLAHALLRTHFGGYSQISWLAPPRRAQAALVEGLAERLGDLRRIDRDIARGQSIVDPGPTAVARVITRRGRVGAGVETTRDLRGRGG